MLDREQLYWELSHQTHGVTWLGPYILDRDHLYVNGEHLVVTVVLCSSNWILLLML